jgi:hypothetical protein
LQQVSSQLSKYFEKFKAWLAERNCHYIETLLQLIKAFMDCLLALKPPIVPHLIKASQMGLILVQIKLILWTSMIFLFTWNRKHQLIQAPTLHQRK